MLGETGNLSVYLALGATDMRKSIDSLAALVKSSFDLDPFSQDLFVFCNRHKNKVKILRWDHNGFWLYYRRLERGRFQWPDRGEGSVSVIDYRQFRWLLDGLSTRQPKAHGEVRARTIV